MNRYSGAANRYAQAIFELAKESGQQDIVFDQLRALQEALAKAPETYGFFNSPMVTSASKTEAIKALIKGVPGVNTLVANLLLLLASRDRIRVFAEIVQAYQDKSDEFHGVTRGRVRSATALGPEDRKRIESIVSNITHKKVILTYTQDQALLGGLIAQVGSFTFDDSLKTHLHRIRDELKRRTQ